jgi:hypothetical protein
MKVLDIVENSGHLLHVRPIWCSRSRPKNWLSAVPFSVAFSRKSEPLPGYKLKFGHASLITRLLNSLFRSLLITGFYVA